MIHRFHEQMKASGIGKLLSWAVFMGAAGLCLGWANTWEDIRAASADITAVRAEFVQEKHLEILVRPLSSNGIFYFKAPHSLRWEYHSPIQSILIAHNGKTKRYVRKNEKVSEDAGANLPAVQMVLYEITRWLKGRFDENPVFSSQIEEGPKIVLRPREKNFADMIQRIELTLADRPGIIQSVAIYEGEDSFTRIEFKNVVLNPPLPDTLFQKM